LINYLCIFFIIAEFEHQIKDSQSNALVTIPALLPVLLPIADKLGMPRSRIFLFGDREIDGCRPYNSFYSSRTLTTPIQGVDGYEDVAFINYSSGTTGVAKGVMLTHKNFIAQILQNVPQDSEEDEPITGDEVTLGFLPFYHVYGLTSLVFNVFYKVIPVVIMVRYDLELLCQLVQKYKITHAAIVPPVGKLVFETIRYGF
jgi:acyl-CoA synthetase (AMP-forming)/AMP-acid ligase II